MNISVEIAFKLMSVLPLVDSKLAAILLLT